MSDLSTAQILEALTVSTLANISDVIFDNMSQSNALFYKLQEKGAVHLRQSGIPIQRTVEFEANNSYTRIQGYDTYNTDASSPFLKVSLDPVQGTVVSKISGYEIKANGNQENQIYNLWKAQLKNTLKTLRNSLSADLYSDGTANKQIKGIRYWIVDNPTTDVEIGGINQQKQRAWRNQTASLAAQSGNVLKSFRYIYNLCTIHNESPDLIIPHVDLFEAYESSLMAAARYQSESMANGKFRALKLGTADVVYDGTSGIPVKHAYFMNTDYFEFVSYGNTLFEAGSKREPEGKNAFMVPIEFMGNLVCTGRRYQGVLTA